ncbi:MAG: tRNA-dihydrouridine synthase family protein [Desulfovibrionaceae bacterium]|nr:tRNA-dihydrouridine synthase family protein [Desulfovibrionaceae bacterium]
MPDWNISPQPAKLPLGGGSPWLAPLAGYTDLPFRVLCREYGAAVCVTEMVSAKGLEYGSHETWRVLATDFCDTPLVVQLFGAEADILGRAVTMLREKGFAWFDLNMGCSVPKVARQGAGSAILKDPDNALACARAMIGAAEPGHVTFKLRLGIGEDSMNWLDVALRLQDAGAGLITLHPRTARQGFSGQARWEELARAKELLDIPVIASGDLLSAADGMRCLEQTGVDGVMYARGALTNPAIFDDHLALFHGRPLPDRTRADLRGMIRRHMDLITRYGSEENALFRLRSIVPRYVRTFPGIRRLRQQLCQCRSFTELDGILAEFLEGEQNAPEAPNSGPESGS